MNLKRMFEMLDMELQDRANTIHPLIKAQYLCNAQDDILSVLRTTGSEKGLVWVDFGVGDSRTFRLPANFDSPYDLRHRTGGYGAGVIGETVYGEEGELGAKIPIVNGKFSGGDAEEAYILGTELLFNFEPAEGLRLRYYAPAWPMFLGKVSQSVSLSEFKVEADAELGEIERLEDSYVGGLICVTYTTTRIPVRRRVTRFDASDLRFTLDQELPVQVSVGDAVETVPLAPPGLHRYIVRIAAAGMMGNRDEASRLHMEILQRAPKPTLEYSAIQDTTEISLYEESL